MSTPNFFHGKSVVITGAASGIGEALSYAFAQQGARLLLADKDADRLTKLAESLRSQGVVCITQVCDVALAYSVQNLAETAEMKLGGTDILINNAGVALIDTVEHLSLEDAQWLMGINFWGVVYGCQFFAPHMRMRSGSVIVNLSSIFAMLSLPTQSIYNASKAAVRAFSDSLRIELGAGSKRAHGLYPVGVLCVNPGGIRTRLVDQARMGDISSMAHTSQALKLQFSRIARTSAERAAEEILNAIVDRRKRILIGTDAKFGDLLYRLFPTHASDWFFRMGQLLRQRFGQREIGKSVGQSDKDK